MAKTSDAKGAGEATGAGKTAGKPAGAGRDAGRDGEADWSATLYLPETDFPMRAGLPQMEPRLLERWQRTGLYARLREQAKGRTRFTLHDGPPYANGNIHIGHALNKILKDFVVRSQQMLGFDSNYVPGWDCHGLPIEWKIEEEYMAKGKAKPNLGDPAAMQAFRAECRAFAEHWMAVQSEEFQRLGVEGDWKNPYTTMTFPAEAQIARELMKFAETGQLYRGSKPVMWSVVEKTALAEAEVEYQDYQSDMVWVKFPVVSASASPEPGVSPASDDSASAVELLDSSIVIWTTTPWTIPGNRAISYNPRIEYGLYKVTEAPEGNWAKVGEKYILADKLAADVFKSAKATKFERLKSVGRRNFFMMNCAHPLRGAGLGGYQFDIPLLDGEHVTDDAGTGFVHTAPGHGREDFDIWMRADVQRSLRARGIDTTIPYTVDADGAFTNDAPGFTGERVITEKGEKGKANEAVIKALAEVGMMVARGRLKHQYPHSWRSKKPVIFRNTPQWFIHMDKPIEALGGRSLREVSLEAIRATEWVPAAGENRITGMIEAKPDWVISRQRAWGVPITVFVAKGTNEVLVDPKVNRRIYDAMHAEGADAWFTDPDGARFLAPDYDPADFEKVNDVLDVWFDSGSTHTYVLEDKEHFPGLYGFKRRVDGGNDIVMYLEGSDQHRGWFHSSLIESCGTRGHAPYDVVLTHGFVLDEAGNKMSKASRNGVSPQDAIKGSGADILRLWVAGADYANDVTLSTDIMRSFADLYRKIRNTLRWMLGTLAHYPLAPSDAHSASGAVAPSDARSASGAVALEDMPELERLMLHRLAELDGVVRQAYRRYDYARVVATLSQFMNTELSAFYFDVRKDALYCEPPASTKRLAALACVEELFRHVTVWLAPILVFTSEEAWLARSGEADERSVHLETFPEVPANWRDDVLAAKWAKVRRVRSVVNGALEVERREKRIGSSLEAAPIVHVTDGDLLAALEGVDMAEVCITSVLTVKTTKPPKGAFTLEDVAGVAVVARRAEGKRCERSWRFVPDVGQDPEFPTLSSRDAEAVRQRRALGLAGGA
ncbi:MAG: isoleucine--tRNA ligase [Rhizobiales bacterium]|nr:isoleucine--tRNA ligase [Hyphomicrobiales bacterium]